MTAKTSDRHSLEITGWDLNDMGVRVWLTCKEEMAVGYMLSSSRSASKLGLPRQSRWNDFNNVRSLGRLLAKEVTGGLSPCGEKF